MVDPMAAGGGVYSLRNIVFYFLRGRSVIGEVFRISVRISEWMGIEFVCEKNVREDGQHERHVT